MTLPLPLGGVFALPSFGVFGFLTAGFFVGVTAGVTAGGAFGSTATAGTTGTPGTPGTDARGGHGFDEAVARGHAYAEAGADMLFVEAPGSRNELSAIVKVLAQPDVKKKINEQGAEVYSETPEQFAALIQAESVKWGKVVKESGASLD